MVTRTALVALHGMGRVDDHYADALFEAVQGRLGEDAAQVSMHAVRYQVDLDVNQSAMWQRMNEACRLDWARGREFLMFYLADAVGLETGKELPGSSYVEAQTEVARTLLAAHEASGGGRLVVAAHSLGAQVMSCYLYDAQRWARSAGTSDGSVRPPSAGIWAAGRPSVEAALGRAIADDAWVALQGRTIQGLVTFGANIPLFVASHRQQNICAIEPPRTGFAWHNFYDRDDILGWPLQPMRGGYEDLVADHEVRAGTLITGWNPASHTAYWDQREIVQALHAQLQRCLQPLPPTAADPRPVRPVDVEASPA